MSFVRENHKNDLPYSDVPNNSTCTNFQDKIHPICTYWVCMFIQLAVMGRCFVFNGRPVLI